MTSIDFKKLLLGTTLIAGFTAFAAAPTFAQDAPIETTPTTIDEDDGDDGDEVVVTGSRLKKDTFQSVAPLQVIDTELATESGLLNPVEILQTSSVAGGQQIDSTFQGFVLDNGPGSETVDLRGLGASRTLVLINGRRMAPAGVEGAPSQPSINLIPSTMVERFDLLTDGASSVYGSDAVSGVVNAILKSDFDGLEVTASADAPEQGAGEDFTIGASYGINGDRGYIGGGIEYDYQDAVKIGDRDFLSGCDTYQEVTENGEIRTVNTSVSRIPNALGMTIDESECLPSRLTQRFITGDFGSIYYQPGISNTGIPGFSESTLFSVPIDGNGDGVVDVAFPNFSPNGQQQDLEDLISERKRWSGMLVGELTLDGSLNATPYFEALYSDIDVEANSGQPQLFPFVSANNPFNPCNLAQPNGVDCNAAYNATLLNPTYLQNFQQFLNTDLNPFGTTNCFGIGDDPFCNPATFGLLLPTGQSLTARPVIGVRGDRNSTSVDLTQMRVVGGVRGDLPFMSFGDVKDWSFDVSASHSVSQGRSVRTGIRGDRLNFALGNDIASGAPIGNTPCDIQPGQNADLTAGCVPVNLFAPSLYSSAAGGDFATQAERDYLFDTRDFDTDISQTIVDGIVQGDLFTLPGGDVSLLVGAQYREDTLDSQPDNIAADGLFFGFFSDGGAAGSRTTKELYSEMFIPLGLGVTGMKELNVELAGRLTDDEFYGTNETFSAKVGWRPIDSLLLRGTVGTSFRAPNLRELFLRSQTGFGTASDPCAVPDVALGGGIGGGTGYSRPDDPRTDITLDNCRAAGIDPETFRANQGSNISLESSAGGSFDLDPETSDSFTLGFSFEQPFTDAFDLDFGMTYYEIDIDNTVVEPSAGFIIDDCYNQQPNQTSAFCDRITRDFNDVNNPGEIVFVDRGFINRDNETAKGYDFNARLRKSDIQIGERSFDFGVNANANHKTERQFKFTLPSGELDIDEAVGEFGFADWRAFITPYVEYDNFRLTWTTSYQSGVEIDKETQVANGLRENLQTDPDGPVIPGARLFDNFNDGTNFGAVTCAGVAAGDVNCRPVVEAGEYWEHSVSLSYRGEDWRIVGGVSNVFDEKPPLVDPRFVFSRGNAPLGNGYNFDGREFFVSVRKNF